MPVTHRRAVSRVPYEEGGDFGLAYPDYVSPQARLVMLRNPAAGTAKSSRTLAQNITATPTGRMKASSVSAVSVESFRRAWSVTEVGWPQGQRIENEGVVQATTTTNVSGSTDYNVRFGFRSFDGQEPGAVELIQLSGADAVLVTTPFVFTADDLIAYPRGGLNRISLDITTHASTAKLRIQATSSVAGEDFLLCDLHAEQGTAGLDCWAESDQLLDADGDGRGDAWSTVSGTPDLQWYGQGALGLEQWAEFIAEGGLNAFEFRQDGSGDVVSVRLRQPIRDIGFTRHRSGMAGPVSVEFVQAN